MGINDRLRKVIKAINHARIYYRDGGVSSVNISYPNFNDLLKGRTVLVTGGGSGIGLAIAKKCAKCGSRVLITGRNEEKLKQSMLEIGQDNCKYIVWDISKVDIVRQKLDECQALLGGEISVLINNAGIPPSKFWDNIDEEEWDKIYSINLKGMFFLTQELVKRWKKQYADTCTYKKIINISSQGGFVGATYPYRMVKWDIRGLTEGLGKTLIKDRIIVNGIAPGVVKTSMQNFAVKQGGNLFTSQNPIRRVILPEEIAELAIFLVSDASNAIVGQTIVCDGGFTLK